MGLFKSKIEKELDDIIQSMIMNMSNNYKDNAQANLRELEEKLEEVKAKGLMKEKAVNRYELILSDYQGRMKGYSHKDQKPYWT